MINSRFVGEIFWYSSTNGVIVEGVEGVALTASPRERNGRDGRGVFFFHFFLTLMARISIVFGHLPSLTVFITSF